MDLYVQSTSTAVVNCICHIPCSCFISNHRLNIKSMRPTCITIKYNYILLHITNTRYLGAQEYSQMSQVQMKYTCSHQWAAICVNFNKVLNTANLPFKVGTNQRKKLLPDYETSTATNRNKGVSIYPTWSPAWALVAP